MFSTNSYVCRVTKVHQKNTFFMHRFSRQSHNGFKLVSSLQNFDVSHASVAPVVTETGLCVRVTLRIAGSAAAAANLLPPSYRCRCRRAAAKLPAAAAVAAAAALPPSCRCCRRAAAATAVAVLPPRCRRRGRAAAKLLPPPPSCPPLPSCWVWVRV